MATHDSRSTILLFGGNDGSSNLGDTWEWGGSEWFSRPAAAGMSWLVPWTRHGL